ncbi:LrgB family protein [uncultured Treponema sp.]|uniref:LrgB family protein n=1 Tax=uncultured Treponema sp. TaxID=162155 RepID=UPI0025D42BD8|nr:LrgB family protein [uncultured Treponema sp.]
MDSVSDFLTNSTSFGLFISLVCFWIADLIYKKTKFVLFAPLLVSCTFIIIFLVIFKIPYEKYLEGAKFLYYLMTPCTVALAIPLYRQFSKLKENALAIILGILSGILANGFFIFGMCWFFKIGHTEYVSLLPKSITTPIGIALSNQNGGIESVTILLISIAGNLANIFGIIFCKLFRIKEPVACGLACGTSGHAMGTAKAFEMGEVQGAMSGLSIAVCGVLTVVIMPFFVNLI